MTPAAQVQHPSSTLRLACGPVSPQQAVLGIQKAMQSIAMRNSFQEACPQNLATPLCLPCPPSMRTAQPQLAVLGHQQGGHAAQCALPFRKWDALESILGLTPFIVAHSHVLCADQDSCAV